MKTCKICKVSKPDTEYNTAYKTTKRTYCRECQIAKNQESYAKRKDNDEVCKCGASLKNKNKYAHRKTKKHLKYLEALTVDFD